MTGKHHKPDCHCQWCALVRQRAKGASTTKDDRKFVTIHLSTAERVALQALADKLGTSAKAVVEDAVRALLEEVE